MKLAHTTAVALAEMFTAQWELQVDGFDVDPQALRGEERAEYVRWNALALIAELTEALEEVGWKPWASDRSISPELFLKELVDAFHFLVNLALVAGGELRLTPWETGTYFADLYASKRQTNLDRQLEGYTGTDKCPECKRDRATTMVVSPGTPDLHYCPCGYSYDR